MSHFESAADRYDAIGLGYLGRVLMRRRSR